jgi:hypothetical protein
MRVIKNLLITRDKREFAQASSRGQDSIRRIGVKFSGQVISLLNVFQVNWQNRPSVFLNRIAKPATPMRRQFDFFSANQIGQFRRVTK